MIGVIGRLERTFKETIRFHKDRGIMFTYLGSPFSDMAIFEDTPEPNKFKFVSIISHIGRLDEELEYISKIHGAYSLFEVNKDNKEKVLSLLSLYKDKIVLHGNTDCIDCHIMVDTTKVNLVKEENVDTLLSDDRIKCISISNIENDWDLNILNYLVRKCSEKNIDILINEPYKVHVRIFNILDNLRI